MIGPSGSGHRRWPAPDCSRRSCRASLRGANSGRWPSASLGVDPLESLAIELRRAIGAPHDTGGLRALIGDLRSEARTLHLAVREALASAPPERRLVVLIDQFEELFTLCRDEGLRQALLDNLHYAATVVGGQTIVVVALRADFYGKCATYPNFAALLSDHHMLVGPMSPQELRQAIERPAQLVGADLEPGLVETLLDDVRGQSTILPLLQHALQELWNNKSGRTLTHAAYPRDRWRRRRAGTTC